MVPTELDSFKKLPSGVHYAASMGRQETQAQLIDQLVSLSSLTAGITRGIVEEVGLTESQANLLWLVDPDADPAPLRQLATRLRCDPSNVTLLSARLEELGLVRRAPHPTDGRVRTLVLTPAGRKARRRLLVEAQGRSPFGVLTEREQLQLHRLLAKALDRVGPPPPPVDPRTVPES